MANVQNEDEKLKNAISLLSSESEFYNTLKLVLSNWPISTAVNLTNKQQNRRAWLGAAGCMYTHKAPEYITRLAWGELSTDLQNKANAVAENIISLYENPNQNAQTLFG